MRAARWRVKRDAAEIEAAPRQAVAILCDNVAMSSQANPHVVLVGAGHAHLRVAADAARFVEAGVRLTLVDPGAFWYSGLATGMLGGMYAAEQDQLDPQPLIEAGGGMFVRDAMVGLDRQRRQVQLASGRTLGFDVLSLNLGSRVPVEALEGAAEHAWAVKPIANLYRLRQHLRTHFAMGRSPRVAVIGGGPTGCELACNLVALAHREQAMPRVSLIARSSRILPDASPGASRFLTRWLEDRGVEVRCQTPVQRMEGRTIVTLAGPERADITILATGLKPPAVLKDWPLPTGPGGGLLVEGTLQASGDSRVFGAGDCIDFAPRPLPKVGVYGVRQGAVLSTNLLAAATGRPLKPYRPQRRYLIILNIGSGQALAIRGRLWARGRWCMRWKDHLDQGFLRKYREAG